MAGRNGRERAALAVWRLGTGGRARLLTGAAWALLAAIAAPGLPNAQIAPVLPESATVAGEAVFASALAAAVAGDADLSAFYAARNHAPIWTGPGDADRRAAFVAALAGAGDHGLPVRRFDPKALVADFHAVVGENDRASLEAEVARLYLDYARAVNSGILEPARIDPGIVREVRRPDPAALLAAIAGDDPAGFLRALPPQSGEYARLMKERKQLEALATGPGWGPRVAADSLKPGQSGPAVIALRNRLVALGYLRPTALAGYDATLKAAVAAFQQDNGLTADGTAGPATIVEINREPAERLASVLVALERERWSNFDRGERHIWVNLTDFVVKLIDDGKVTFETRAVIGKDSHDRRTPEFSDSMAFMVVNPSWSVPRSITTGEYLPLLQKNPNAVGHIQVVDSRGRVVDRGAVDFSKYSARSFPFAMRQAPGPSNALGRVKFMFPNKWNIYLHDTPQKSLFGNEVRAYSHGCVRLSDPFDFAYALLAKQEADPQAFFKRQLDSGRETTVMLKQPVPIHIDYRTAFTKLRGGMEYRRDIYGRDAAIFEALGKAGVALPGVQG